MTNTTAINLLKEVTQIHGISGHEKQVSRWMKQQMEPYADEIIYDNLGSIFALKKSKQADAPKVMISGHMDEVGFLVAQILESGSLKIHPVGGWFSQNLLSHRISVTNREGKVFKGAIASVPPHLLSAADRTKPVEISQMLVDIGATSKQEVLQWGIQTGDMLVLDGSFEQLSETRFLSKAFDNRYGCALAVQTLQDLKDIELPFDLYIGATVQEEVGLRGAKSAVNMIKPDMAIVLDCSPANDISGDKSGWGQLGEGVLIRVVDSGFIAHLGFIHYFEDLCKQHGIKHQRFISAGGTDASAIHSSLEGVMTLTCCICSRNIHSSSSIIDIRDYESAHLALKELILSLNNDKIESIRTSNR